MAVKWTPSILILIVIYMGVSKTQKACPTPKDILPCRCFLRSEEFQIWCTHSDLPSVLDGLQATAKYIQGPIDELILENNFLPSLPGRALSPLKIIRLMLRYNGLESVSNYWLGGQEVTLMELFIVEPKLRTIPNDSLMHVISLQAITIQSNVMKRLPLFSGLPKLRYVEIQSSSLQELSTNNFRDNPALEKLFIGHCPKLNRLDADTFVDLPSLTLLNISNCGLNWMHPRAIKKLPILKELVLMTNRFIDAGLIGRGSRELPRLEVIRLDGNHIDMLGEAAFVNIPSLRELHLSRNRIVEIHKGAFHGVPNLRKLNLNENFLKRVHPDSFLQESPNGLEELWLVKNEINHVADLRAILDAFPRLIFLDMSYNHLEAIPFRSLRGHSTLEHLNLAYNRIHLIDREAIASMPSLRELRLRNNSLSNKIEHPLWNLPELRGLDLSNNFLRRIKSNLLQNLPSLRKVDISGNQLIYMDADAFTHAPSLENINVSFNSLETVHPDTFRFLLGLYELDFSNNMLKEFVPGLPKGIEYLHLENNDITAFPLNPIINLNLPALRMLDLTGNKLNHLPTNGFPTIPELRKLLIGKNLLIKINDGDLKGLTKLETLDVSENAVVLLGPNAFKYQSELRNLNLGVNKLELLLPQCFQFCPHLKNLNLSQNIITEMQPGTLNKNKKLQMLDLSKNRFEKMSSGFIGLRNLQMLDLSGNRLVNIDSEILQRLPSLKTLKLSQNYIKEVKENGFTKLQHLTSLELEENDLKVIKTDTIKDLPTLSRLKLNRNKIKQILNMAFVNLPSLQMLELQENEISFIAPNAFVEAPHLLMLNLSYNQIPSLEMLGLNGIRSLEMLDIRNNFITSVGSSNLEQMEWLVELRLDGNKICSVHGSPFNNMPRLRVLSMKNNKIMSFPERYVEKILSNLAVLDIQGNPLSCSCNMLWLQGWLLETASVAPRCANGYLLSELELPKDDCSEQERNIEIVAPGCEADLLSAPGIFSSPQSHASLFNGKSLNNSQELNSLAPSPEQSDYFYDEYVDYPYNDTNVSDRNGSRLVTSASGIKNGPKQIKDSPSSSKFTFFGIPLPHIANILYNAVDATRNEKQSFDPSKNTDRLAVVTKQRGTSNIIEKFYPPPYLPEVETGGFVPLVPGEGGFKPILNPLYQQYLNINKNQKVEIASSTVESSNIIMSTTTQSSEAVTKELTVKTTHTTLPSFVVSDFFMSPTNAPKVDISTTTECLDGNNKIKANQMLPSINERKVFNRASMYLIQQFYDSDKEESIDSTSEQFPYITTIPKTASIKDELMTTSEFPNLKSTILMPIQQSLVRNDHGVTIPDATFLLPEDEKFTKHVGTITKVTSSELQSSPRLNSSTLTIKVNNRDLKKKTKEQQAILHTEADIQNKNKDMSWYFETYNNTQSDGMSNVHKYTILNVLHNTLLMSICSYYLL